MPGVQLVSQKLGHASGVPHGNQQILMPAPWSNEKLRQGQVGRLGSHHLSRLVVSFDFQGVVLAAVDRQQLLIIGGVGWVLQRVCGSPAA